jgi:uroporphyrinogen-III synthase
VNGRPLAGVRVVVTRAEDQAARLAEGFARAGASVACLPLIEVVPAPTPGPLDDACSRLARFDWVVFTSANAVRAVLAKVPSWPRSVRIAAVGSATEAAVVAAGIEVQLTAGAPTDTPANAEGLLAAFGTERGGAPYGARVFLPQAADARPGLGEGLAAAGYRVTRVTAYDKRLPPAALDLGDRLFRSGPLGWVTFSSPRIVRHLSALLGERWEARRSELSAASIGPVTSHALVAAGVTPTAEASEPSDDALVAAVVQSVAR